MTAFKWLVIAIRAVAGVLGFLVTLSFCILSLAALASADGGGFVLCALVALVPTGLVGILKQFADGLKFGERVGEQWLPDWPKLFVDGNYVTVYAPGFPEFKPWSVFWWSGDPHIVLEFSPNEIVIRIALGKKRLALQPGVPVSAHMTQAGRKSELFLKFGVREHRIVALRDQQRAQQFFDILKLVVAASGADPGPRLIAVLRSQQSERGGGKVISSESSPGAADLSMMSTQQAYTILGVTADTPFSEVTEIWRGLRKIYNANEARANEINKAYRVIQESQVQKGVDHSRLVVMTHA